MCLSGKRWVVKQTKGLGFRVLNPNVWDFLVFFFWIFGHFLQEKHLVLMQKNGCRMLFPTNFGHFWRAWNHQGPEKLGDTSWILGIFGRVKSSGWSHVAGQRYLQHCRHSRQGASCDFVSFCVCFVLIKTYVVDV